MYYVQTVAPTSLPLSLDDAKAYMRIVTSDDDDLITAMIGAATEYAQNYTNRQFKQATYELFLEDFCEDLLLPKNPLQSITSVEYLDSDDVYQTLASSSYYLYKKYQLDYLHFDDTVSVVDDKRAVKITFISGYDTVPDSIISWIKTRVSTLYEHREQFYVGVNRIGDFGFGLVDGLLDMYRVKLF